MIKFILTEEQRTDVLEALYRSSAEESPEGKAVIAMLETLPMFKTDPARFSVSSINPIEP